MNGLQRILDNRDFILLAEIGALLHDLGKLSEEFIAQQSSGITENSYLFRHNLILGRSLKFPCHINLTDNSRFELTEADIKSIKEDFLDKILQSRNICSESELKKVIVDIFKNNYNKDISKKKSQKLLDFVREYHSRSCNGDLKLSKCLEKILLQVIGDEVHLADIMAKHHKGENYKIDYSAKLIDLFKSIDGIDSGVDKGVLHNNGKQPKEDTRQATSFGYEANPIDVSKLKSIRDSLCTQLTVDLNIIAQTHGQYENKKITKDDYMSKLLESRTNIHKSVKYAFLKGLGDTRRSGNDVTLWDHSYSVASLYKSALAKIIYENEWAEPREIKWRIIGVQYDKLGLIEKAHKLADIVGYRKLSIEVDEKIKKIVEEEIPLGNEIYRDETGIYFSGPDLGEVELRNLIRERIVDAVQKETDGEVIPCITISDSSRSLVILTELLRDSRNNFLQHETTPNWINNWKDASSCIVSDVHLKQRSFCKKQCRRDCVARGGAKEYQVDICPVCGARPKCEHQDICKRCLERRESRIDGWEKKYQTIWIDEIADKNKRVAVVTGRFNLTRWLNGELLNTVFSQTLEEYTYDWTELRGKLKRCLSSNERNSCLLNEIAREAYKNEPVRDFYDKIVVDRNPQWQDAKVDWNDRPDYQKAAERLLLTIFRKHPSPARLRRIWTTTETFWKDVQKELETKKDIYSSDNQDIRFRRLEIKLKNNENITRTLQNAKFNETNILMYFDGEKLISAQNLSLSGLSGEINLEEYKGEIISIKREDENDSEFKKFEIKDISWGGSYRPFLDILLSPISFQFIVPASSVPNVLRTIQDKYSTEMGEVRGRLPLNMGVVFFDYKTALYAAINASRRMLQGFDDEPCDQFLVKIGTNDPNIELVREGGRRKKIKFEDMVKDSYAPKYYQNFIVAEYVSVEKRNGYFKSFIDRVEVGLLNVSKLIENDKVMIYTNHFDFEFLDTAARRLEIGYENWKRNDQSELRGPRPYYLEEFNTVFDAVWKLFDRSTISQTQIKKIQSQLAKLNLDWAGHESSKEFKTQIENILINIGTRKWWNSMENGEQELLMQVCLDKTIFDILEFYNSILKLKSGGAMNG